MIIIESIFKELRWQTLREGTPDFFHALLPPFCVFIRSRNKGVYPEYLLSASTVQMLVIAQWTK